MGKPKYQSLAFLKLSSPDFPGGPVVKAPSFPLQGVWVQSLVGELGSHMPVGKKISNPSLI